MERYSSGRRRLILKETHGPRRPLDVGQARLGHFNLKFLPTLGERGEMSPSVGPLRELEAWTLTRFTMYKSSTPNMLTMNGYSADNTSNSHWPCVVTCRGKI